MVRQIKMFLEFWRMMRVVNVGGAVAIGLLLCCGTIAIRAQSREASSQHDLGSSLVTTSDSTEPPTSDRDILPPTDQTNQAAGGRIRDHVELDADRQDELMAFVQQNHPELLRVMRRLKKQRPEQFQNALRMLDHQVRVLERLQRRGNPLRYQQALDDWNLRSRIRLASAQLALNNSTENREALQQLVAQQLESQIQRWEAERVYLQNRLKVVEQLLENNSGENQAQIIEDRMNRIVKSANKMSKQRLQIKEKNDQSISEIESTGNQPGE